MAIGGFPVPSGAPPRAGLTGGELDLAQVHDPNTLALLYFHRWTPVGNADQPATLMPYAFATRASDFSPPPPGFAVLSQAQQEASRTTFDLVSSYTNLSFRAAAVGDAAIRISVANESSAGPPDWNTQGDTFFGSNGVVPDTVGGVPKFFGTDGFLTIMHELGHALGIKHGHYEVKNPPSPRSEVALAANVNDNEFSIMTYASYLGSPIDPFSAAPTAAKEGSSPQSFMMYDIAALQAMYGANFGKVGTIDIYRWNGSTGQETINGSAAPGTGLSSTGKIFSTVWTQGAIAIYDLRTFDGQDQVDDLRPGHFLKFSDGQLANLTNDPAIPDGTAGYTAQGNIYNALIANGDMRSLIADLITGSGNDTLIGNDRDNKLTGNAGNDILVTAGGNDTVSGGPGADAIYFGPGHNILRDTAADLAGDTVFDFGLGAVDVLGARLGAANLTVTPQQTTLTAGASTVVLNGHFADGEFLISQRGSGADVHTAIAFVPYLPTLAEGVAVQPSAINGIASQPFLSGDGAARFTVDFRGGASAFSNEIGWYKVRADGTIGETHVLIANTHDAGAVGRSFDLGAPANGERIGFFLIQDGFNTYGTLPDDLSFVLPSGQAANVDFWQAPVLQSASLGQLNGAPVFHSFAGLNPDWSPQVLSGLQGGRELLLGFEDLRYFGGDRDYQDVVLAVHFTPEDVRIL